MISLCTLSIISEPKIIYNIAVYTKNNSKYRCVQLSLKISLRTPYFRIYEIQFFWLVNLVSHTVGYVYYLKIVIATHFRFHGSTKFWNINDFCKNIATYTNQSVRSDIFTKIINILKLGTAMQLTWKVIEIY